MFNVSSSVGMNLNYAGQNLSTGPYAKKVENHRARKENYYSELGESQPMYPRFQPSFFFNLPSSNAHLAWTGVKKERKKKKFGQKTMNEWIGFVVEGCWEGGGGTIIWVRVFDHHLTVKQTRQKWLKVKQ